LYRIYQRKPDLKDMIEKVIGQHIERVSKLMASSAEKAEDLKEELEGAKNLIDAPNQPMITNFDDEKMTK